MQNEDLFQEENVDDSKLKLPDVQLEKQDIKSLEEDEEVLFKERARLLRYDLHVHTGNYQWKERGKGNIKLLKHKVMGKIRVLMRQEKTLKLCANHLVDPAYPLKEHPASDKAWMFSADDFSEEELKHETLCIMFRDHETAMKYKVAHDAACAEMAGTATAAAPVAAAAAAPAAPAAGGAGGGAGAGEAAADAEATTAEDPVLVTNDLSAIYADEAVAADAAKRIAALGAEFAKRFGMTPHFFARAPGRVNLIGEHIDYHGYSVLPMALTNDVLIAVAVTGPEATISVENFLAKYKGGEIPSDPSVTIDVSEGIEWFQYFHCGYKGAFEASATTAAPAGMKVMVDGNVPPGGGLSSSSALVVASTLATACANQISLDRTALAKASMKCEGYCGTMGGGMDQTISCLAEAGKAALIDFEPSLKATPVTLPAGTAFVVAHSLKEAPKAVSPWEGYNCRVVEGKLAAKIVAKKAGIADWKGVQTISGLQKALGLSSPAELEALVEEHLKDGDYSVAELSAELGVADVNEAFVGDAKAAGAAKVLDHVTGYACKARMRHVVTEAARVHQFAELCNGDGADAAEFGSLLNASHSSCAKDYACSCPELDELVELAVASGAIGARLTGAGWGGCMVAMVAAADVETFLKALADGYYEKKGVPADQMASKMFATTPGSGVALYLPSAE